MGKTIEEQIIREILERGVRAVFAPNFSKILDEVVTETKIPDSVERARVRSKVALAMIEIRKKFRERAS